MSDRWFIVCLYREFIRVVANLASTLLIACLSYTSSSQINVRAGKLNNIRMKVIINHVNNNQSRYYINSSSNSIWASGAEANTPPELQLPLSGGIIHHHH
jgi:hypothetical protein